MEKIGNKGWIRLKIFYFLKVFLYENNKETVVFFKKNLLKICFLIWILRIKIFMRHSILKSYVFLWSNYIFLIMIWERDLISFKYFFRLFFSFHLMFFKNYSFSLLFSLHFIFIFLPFNGVSIISESFIIYL